MNKSSTMLFRFLHLTISYELKTITTCIYYILISFIKNYLTNREQYVIYNNFLSSKCTITTGVPQGSILGPLLFLLYINDISNSSAILKFILFADDTNIFYSCENFESLCTTVNRELREVIQWFKSNRLSVNLKKTNFIIFGSPL